MTTRCRAGVEADELQQFGAAPPDPAVVLAALPGPQRQRGAQDALDGAGRIERRVRILVDHLDPAEVRLPLPRPQPAQGLAVDDQLTAVEVLEPAQDPAQGGLAAAGLADERDRPAVGDREVDAAQRADRVPAQQPAAGGEGAGQAAALDHGRSPGTAWQATR